MPFPGSRLFSTFALLLLLPATALAAPVDWNAFQWDHEFGQGPNAAGQVLPGRLVVRFAPGQTPGEAMAGSNGEIATGELPLDRVARGIGTRRISRMFPDVPSAKRMTVAPDRDQWFVIEFDPSTSSVRDAARAFAGLANVAEILPDPVARQYSTLPNDPGLSSQWWLRNQLLGGGGTRAASAWSFSTGSADVLVAIPDSGVDWQHPDLGGTGPDYIDGIIKINDAEWIGLDGIDDDGNGKIDDFRGWDFVTGLNPADTKQTPPQDVNTEDNDPMDYGGHGTAVTGCVSALTNNSQGIASINWTTKILPCRTGWTGSDGNGYLGSAFNAQAIDYARIMGADVINASWGGPWYGPLASKILQATNAGIIVVVAAGNANTSVADYPASDANVITVAATNANDAKASFSSYGAWVEISAPGVAIYTTSFDPSNVGAAQHGYGNIQGTSFSSPIVAGAFALARAYYPADTRQEAIDRVLAAVDDLDALNPGYIGLLGSGRLNLTKLFYEDTKWPVPMVAPTIFDGLQLAAPTDTVAVEGGHVIDEPLYYSGVVAGQILGGFDATFTTRDPVGNKSILQPLSPSSPALNLTNVSSNLVFDGFAIIGGRATSPSLGPDEGFYGGSVSIINSSPILRNLSITGGQAGFSGDFGAGGGMAILSSSPTLENVEVSGCGALMGAAIYVYDSTPTLTDLNIHDNTSWAGSGGETGFGGGVYIRQSPPIARRKASSITLTGGTISGNTAPGPGGGLYLLDSTMDLNGVTVQDNISQGEGAGIYSTGGSLTVVGSNFVNNDIDPLATFKRGGGIYSTGGPLSVDTSSFSGNSATFSGGAIAANVASAVTVSNSTVVENTATLFGSGISVESGPAGQSFVSNTVANNTGGSVGGNGLYISGGDANFQQNIVAFNGSGANSADGINLITVTATFSCNLVYGNVNGNYGGVTDPTGTNGNISVDPLFCDMAMSIYTIDQGSPANTAACGFMGSEIADCNNSGTGVGDEVPGVPRAFALRQNSPNPFNPLTRIEFSLPGAGPVSLKVYDLKGRRVTTLLNRDFDAGTWSVTWDGRDDSGHSVASGTYLYELRTHDGRQIRKMGLIK